MTITFLDNGLLSDSFEMGEEPLIFKDALVMRQKDYEALSAEEIAALKQARYDNWLAIINTPAGPPDEQMTQE